MRVRVTNTNSASNLILRIENLFLKHILNILRRIRTQQTHKIYALPIVIMMPHSACNCRCIMCDIWKDNKNLKQLNPSDVSGILGSLKKFNTKIAVMSGGEALLNKNFFDLCKILRAQGIKITLLSTGLTLKQHAKEIVNCIDEVIVSLDGTESVHNQIRRIPDAFRKMQEGILELKKLKPSLRVTARSVIQNENYKVWSGIIEAAKQIGLHQISFLPADMSSVAFNRPTAWEEGRKEEVQLPEKALTELKEVIEKLIVQHGQDFKNKFIAESPQKIRKIYTHYAANYGLNPYPHKKCNAPWVSTVIESDGTLRHCFFLESAGNIRMASLEELVNSKTAIAFRKNLNTQQNPTCVKCVCSLNLPVRSQL